MTAVPLICVGNAGRSQMATAFAEREPEQRGLDDTLEIATGGIGPHEHIHDDVIEVLREAGIDISDHVPRRITAADVIDAEYVVTMDCSVGEFVPDDWDGTAERWEANVREVATSMPFGISATRSGVASTTSSIESGCRASNH